jgi:hypothetical protein
MKIGKCVRIPPLPSSKIAQLGLKHDSNFLKSCGLDDRDVAGKGGISITSAGIIRDDSDNTNETVLELPRKMH